MRAKVTKAASARKGGGLLQLAVNLQHSGIGVAHAERHELHHRSDDDRQQRAVERERQIEYELEERDRKNDRRKHERRAGELIEHPRTGRAPDHEPGRKRGESGDQGCGRKRQDERVQDRRRERGLEDDRVEVV
jgi:hypothetical protein